MTKRRVLILDDEVTIRESAGAYFAAVGFAVDLAADRGQAETLVAGGEPYDAVITDVRLGGASDYEGLAFAAFVRRERPGTRIIVVTAFATEELEREAARSGADAFLEKPMPLSALAGHVRRLLS